MKEKKEAVPHPTLATMQEEILNNLGDAQRLESLYQSNKATFKQAFGHVYTEMQDHTVLRVWHARLNPANTSIQIGSLREWIYVGAAIILAGFLAKIPDLIGQEPDLFYQRNVGFIVFPLMASYFSWKTHISVYRWLMIMAVFGMSAIYINLLPHWGQTDTLVLACLHLPVFLWALVGFTFMGGKLQNKPRTLDFLRFNGDLVVMSAIMCIAGGMLTAITFGMFALIEVDLANVFEHFLLVWGIPAVPLLAGFLVFTHPQLVNKISPVIARIFTPLVLVSLVAFLVAVVVTGKDPYNNREFLVVFNLMLLGVMALILFSTSEIMKTSGKKIEKILLACLSAVAIIVNSIALSAIIFRIAEWGMTPNRLAVLGANVLMLIHLIWVSYHLFRSIQQKDEVENVDKSIASFLPVYVLWTLVVVILIPLLFGYQ